MDQSNLPTWAAVIVAFAAVVVAVVQAFIYNGQAKIMRGQFRVGAQAARATMRAANTAERALTIVESAFVTIKDIGVDTYGNNARILGYGIRINIINYGRTTAKSYRSNASLVAIDKIPENLRYPDRVKSDAVGNTLGPGATTHMLIQVSIQDIIDAFEQNKEVIIYGWLEYDDIFDKTTQHRTEFCMKIGALGDPRTTRIIQGQTSVLGASA